MAILSFNNLGQSFAEIDIFSGLTAGIPNKGRVGLVGPNGVGKTTLLRVLAGVSKPTSGEIHLAKKAQIGYLRQEAERAFANTEHTVYQEMLTVFDSLKAQEAQLRQMEQAMTNGGASETLLEQYGQAQEAFELAGGYNYDLRIQQTLDGLGFGPDMWDMPLQHCSGGQKTRALLARLILQEPDLLILDEPTNHLDIAALEWLENRLKSWRGAILIVSHDRYFLDKVVDTIWEMYGGAIETYRGNYSAYLTQRAERWARREEEFQTTIATFLKELDYIKRNIARDSTTDQAKGRLRRLIRQVKAVEVGGTQALNQKWSEFMREGPGISGQKWNVSTVEEHIKGLRSPNSYHQPLTMRLKVTEHLSNQIVMAQNLEIGYPGNKLFTVKEIALYQGAIAALIGPNGSGKSTFLRTLMGELEPLAGKLRLGSSLKVGYFAQAHDKLNPNSTVIEELIAQEPMMLPAQARDYLAQYLFKGEDVYKPISALSGGERGRLSLAIMALYEVNFLILDEPTNHLDIPSQEVLQEALEHFKGTVLLVTHDRYLVDHLATEIWELKDNQMNIHQGNYSSYLAWRDQKTQAEQAAKTNANTNWRGPEREKEKAAKKAAKELAQLEDQIHTIELKLNELGLALETATQNERWEKIKSLSEAYTSAERELEALMETWETLV